MRQTKAILILGISFLFCFNFYAIDSNDEFKYKSIIKKYKLPYNKTKAENAIKLFQIAKKNTVNRKLLDYYRNNTDKLLYKWYYYHIADQIIPVTRKKLKNLLQYNYKVKKISLNKLVKKEKIYKYFNKKDSYVYYKYLSNFPYDFLIKLLKNNEKEYYHTKNITSTYKKIYNYYLILERKKNQKRSENVNLTNYIKKINNYMIKTKWNKNLYTFFKNNIKLYRYKLKNPMKHKYYFEYENKKYNINDINNNKSFFKKIKNDKLKNEYLSKRIIKKIENILITKYFKDKFGKLKTSDLKYLYYYLNYNRTKKTVKNNIIVPKSYKNSIKKEYEKYKKKNIMVNFRLIKIRDKEIYNKIIKKLNKNNFEKYAKRYSNHPTKHNGGNFGYVRIKNLSDSIESYIKKLKVNHIKSFFDKSDNEYYILNLLSKKFPDITYKEYYKKKINEFKNKRLKKLIGSNKYE